MFKCLKIHIKNDLVFDPCYQYVTSDQDTEANIRDTKDLYVDSINKLPPNVPKPRGRTIHINCFSDSDHVVDRVTR